MRRAAPCLLLLGPLLLAPLAARADDPPSVEFQPTPCSVPDKPIRLCASVADDNQVGAARIYFRPAGEKYFSFVDMAFGGINYCGTIPAPREGKVKTLEYYVQAMDNAYQAQRTSTYQLAIQAEGVCQFPPVETDAARVSSIKVYATSDKQGKKLPDEFSETGVTFVPVKR
jgi:hypothetical protein